MGRVLSRHRGSTVNVFAGCVLASLATVGGALLLAIMVHAIWHAKFDLPWNAKVGWSWFAVFWGVIADGLIFLIAAILWRVTSSIFNSVITVHENGLSIAEGDDVRDIPWQNVLALVDVDVRERIPVLHFPANLLLPRWRSRKYEIWINGDSEPCCFDKNSVSDISRFGSILHDACQRYDIPVTRRIENDM